MNSLGITGTEQIFLGVYLIAHGLIHVVFLFYFKDKKTNVITGWSRKSWLLDKMVSRGVIHRNTAANKKSRMMKYVNSLT